MSIKELPERSLEQPTNSGRKTLFTIPIVIALLIVGVIAFVACQGTDTSTQTTSRPSLQYTPPNPPTAMNADYKDTVKNQVAQALHLTASQLQARLHANSNDLYGAAQDQSINQDQLSTIVTTAFQAANSHMVSTGQWTQQQADAEMQYWNQRSSKALVGDVTNFFIG